MIGVTLRRRYLLTLLRTGLVAIFAVAVALASGPGAAHARAADACAAGSSLYVVAHEDDSFLFQAPDLIDDIRSGRCVRTVFVTSGNAGLDETYWRGREEGAKAAYAAMALTPGGWTAADAGLRGHPAPLLTLAAKPTVSLVFLRLPDGQSRGEGFARTGFVSMKKLWQDEIPSLTTVDGTSSYSKDDLVATLAALIETARPDRIATQDFVGNFGEGDHSDHYATAYFTRAAADRTRRAYTLVGYSGYTERSYPVNLPDPIVTEKQAAWRAYAPFDPSICQTWAECQFTGYLDLVVQAVHGRVDRPSRRSPSRPSRRRRRSRRPAPYETVRRGRSACGRRSSARCAAARRGAARGCSRVARAVCSRAPAPEGAPAVASSDRPREGALRRGYGARSETSAAGGLCSRNSRTRRNLPIPAAAVSVE